MQIAKKYCQDNQSYLRGRKMAERKKEVETRWIVGYERTSQWVADQRVREWEYSLLLQNKFVRNAEIWRSCALACLIHIAAAAKYKAKNFAPAWFIWF